MSDQAPTEAPAAAPAQAPAPAATPVEQHVGAPDTAPAPASDPAAPLPTPLRAEDYKTELNQDFTLPEGQALPAGYEFDQQNPRLIAFRKIATDAGLSQKQFSAMLGIEAANVANGQAVLHARDAALGENAQGRLNELATWLDTSFDKETAFQLKGTLWSGKMVKAFESMKKAVTSQGVGSFNAGGREAPDAADGKPAGWETASAVDRLTWIRQQQREH